MGISRERIEEIHQVKPTRLLEALSVAEQKMGSAVPPNVGRSGLQPVVDGHILPTHPFDPVGPALSAGVPFMVGSTRNEASVSINNAVLESLDEEGLKKKIADRFGAKGDRVYQVLRKVHPSVKPVEVLSFISAQNPIAYLQAIRKSAQNSAPVYQYLFAWHTPVLDGRPRSFHCSEIPFAFGNTDRCENYTGASDEARKLGDKMSKAWISFAHYGNPNHKGLPEWPAFNEKNGAIMVFNNHCEVRNDPDGEAREMLQHIFYNKDI